MSLRLRDLRFSYGAEPVVDGLDLQVAAGEMVALLGASGCGKTSILKLIAGLLRPDAGVIELNGRDLSSEPTERRRISIVFQKPLLFPYLSVGENVGFSLKLKGVGEAAAKERVREALALVKLDGYEGRRPNELSGGQEQRVSLARALVNDPDLLLLDEPFAALDENLRVEIRSLVAGIQRRLKLTSIFVTHDQHEAAAVAHRIAFMDRGRILQMGSLREFYEHPESLEAARFFGWQLIDGGEYWSAVRPESIQIGAEGGSGLPGVVESSADLGTVVATTVRLEHSNTTVESRHGLPELSPGQAVSLQFAENSARRFAKS